jgi:hypothetical protein
LDQASISCSVGGRCQVRTNVLEVLDPALRDDNVASVVDEREVLGAIVSWRLPDGRGGRRVGDRHRNVVRHLDDETLWSWAAQRGRISITRTAECALLESNSVLPVRHQQRV